MKLVAASSSPGAANNPSGPLHTRVASTTGPHPVPRWFRSGQDLPTPADLDHVLCYRRRADAACLLEVVRSRQPVRKRGPRRIKRHRFWERSHLAARMLDGFSSRAAAQDDEPPAGARSAKTGLHLDLLRILDGERLQQHDFAKLDGAMPGMRAKSGACQLEVAVAGSVVCPRSRCSPRTQWVAGSRRLT